MPYIYAFFIGRFCLVFLPEGLAFFVVEKVECCSLGCGDTNAFSGEGGLAGSREAQGPARKWFVVTLYFVAGLGAPGLFSAGRAPGGEAGGCLAAGHMPPTTQATAGHWAVRAQTTVHRAVARGLPGLVSALPMWCQRQDAWARLSLMLVAGQASTKKRWRPGGGLYWSGGQQNARTHQAPKPVTEHRGRRKVATRKWLFHPRQKPVARYQTAKCADSLIASAHGEAQQAPPGWTAAGDSSAKGKRWGKMATVMIPNSSLSPPAANTTSGSRATIGGLLRCQRQALKRRTPRQSNCWRRGRAASSEHYRYARFARLAEGTKADRTQTNTAPMFHVEHCALIA